MATSYVWPPALPQSPQDSFSGSKAVNVLRTPMDAGPAKMRRRSAGVETMSCTFYMTNAQIALLDEFIEETIMATARFAFKHPRTQAIVEARIVPQSNGEMYSYSYITNDWWSVGIAMEILP